MTPIARNPEPIMTRSHLVRPADLIDRTGAQSSPINDNSERATGLLERRRRRQTRRNIR